MRQNVAGQVACAQLIRLDDGSPCVTGTTSVYVVGDNGTQSTGTGACTHKGNGTWFYYPSQAETNFGHIVFTFVNSLAISTRAEYETEIATRIAAQVVTGPVAVVPAPATNTQTTAWCYCFDKAGAPQQGVIITVGVYGATGNLGAYSTVVGSATSNGSGVASLAIPRGAHLKFNVRRGDGMPVQFVGANVDTLQMPSFIGP
jgi:hypothetical protein